MHMHMPTGMHVVFRLWPSSFFCACYQFIAGRQALLLHICLGTLAPAVGCPRRPTNGCCEWLLWGETLASPGRCPRALTPPQIRLMCGEARCTGSGRSLARVDVACLLCLVTCGLYKFKNINVESRKLKRRKFKSRKLKRRTFKRRTLKSRTFKSRKFKSRKFKSINFKSRKSKSRKFKRRTYKNRKFETDREV